MTLEHIDPIVEKICSYFDGVMMLDHTVPEDRIELAKILAPYIKDHAAMEVSRALHIETHYLSPEDAAKFAIPEDAGWVGITHKDFCMSETFDNPADAILEAAKAAKGNEP